MYILSFLQWFLKAQFFSKPYQECIINQAHLSIYFLALASLPWEPMLTSGPIENMDAVKAKYAEQSDDEVSVVTITIGNWWKFQIIIVSLNLRAFNTYSGL